MQLHENMRRKGVLPPDPKVPVVDAAALDAKRAPKGLGEQLASMHQAAKAHQVNHLWPLPFCRHLFICGRQPTSCRPPACWEPCSIPSMHNGRHQLHKAERRRIWTAHHASASPCKRRRWMRRVRTADPFPGWRSCLTAAVFPSSRTKSRDCTGGGDGGGARARRGPFQGRGPAAERGRLGGQGPVARHQQPGMPLLDQDLDC